MSVALLPPELWEHCLTFVDEKDLQQSVLALSRAFPNGPIPCHHIFRKIRLKRPKDVYNLYRSLRRDAQADWVQEFSLETWDADANAVVNLVRRLSKLKVLKLFIGARNFAPEHLEDILASNNENRWEHLTDVSIQFNPYVQQATYQQFLAGSYFDSSLVAISKWPSNLRSLSIIQHPMQSGFVPVSGKTFAQPIVFFRLEPISDLLTSEATSLLVSLTIRLPSRNVGRFIASRSLDVPSLERLDLSTTRILDQEIDAMLCRVVQLRHLVLDDCRLAPLEGDWSALAKRCALVGTARTRIREKELAEWLELKLLATPKAPLVDPQPGPEATASTRGPRRGRRGLSTATISLRERTPQPKGKGKAPKRIRIFPPDPTLKTVSTTITVRVDTDVKAIREEWIEGWTEGVKQLMGVRYRLHQSSKNGLRIMRFADATDKLDEEENNEGLTGLVDINEEWWEQVLGSQDFSVPLLCLGGQSEIEHEPGCGHSLLELPLEPQS
ncbi:hypothetical protein C8J56DRAFT_817765 [Mycena floridula]|nr:hypothetical protein C8J56DRAFT_817765 [Mycena floridula]